MANTEHTHAGNADQLRDLQNTPVARCNICHWHLHQATQSGSPVELEPVKVQGEPKLACQFCVQAVQLQGLTFDDMAAGMRALTPADEAENQKLLAEMIAEGQQQDVEDLTNY